MDAIAVQSAWMICMIITFFYTTDALLEATGSQTQILSHFHLLMHLPGFQHKEVVIYDGVYLMPVLAKLMLLTPLYI